MRVKQGKNKQGEKKKRKVCKAGAEAFSLGKRVGRGGLRAFGGEC